MLLIALPALAGTDPDPATACRNAIKEASNKVRDIRTASCSPLDPACASLAAAIRSVQKYHGEALRKCVELAQTHCAAYAQALSAKQPGDQAWQGAMRGCSPGIERIPVNYFSCMCDPKSGVKPLH